MDHRIPVRLVQMTVDDPQQTENTDGYVARQENARSDRHVIGLKVKSQPGRTQLKTSRRK